MNYYSFPGTKPTCATVLRATLETFGYTVDQLASSKRMFVIAKQIYCRIALELVKTTLNEIGSLINYRHCDVLYATKTAKNLLETNNSEFCHYYRKIKSKLTAKIDTTAQ